MTSFVAHDQFDRPEWKIIEIDTEATLRVAPGVLDSEIER